MKKLITTALVLAVSRIAFGDIFTNVSKLEQLDSTNKIDMPHIAKANTRKYEKIDTREFVSHVFYIAEENPRFELSTAMRVRKDNLQIRLDYPDAYKLYSSGEIEEFSYFGFLLWEVEQGKLPLTKFLNELQKYLER